MSMQVCPGIYPLLVERIIVARPDLLKADVKEVSFLARLSGPGWVDLYTQPTPTTRLQAFCVVIAQPVGLMPYCHGKYRYHIAEMN